MDVTDNVHSPVLVIPLDCISCGEKASCLDLDLGHRRHNLTADHGPLFCTSTTNEGVIDCYLAQAHMIMEAELRHEAPPSGFGPDIVSDLDNEFLLHLADVKQLCPSLSLYSECFSLENCSSGSANDPLCLTERENIDLVPCPANSSVVGSSCVCEQFSSVPGYNCFWNPISRVTGQYCGRCREVCLSSTYSINFAQFCTGIALFVFGGASMRVTTTVIASDNLGQAKQVSEWFLLLTLSSSFSLSHTNTPTHQYTHIQIHTKICAPDIFK